MSNWSSISTSNTSQGAFIPFQPPVQSHVMGAYPYQPVMMGGYPPLPQPAMMPVPVMYVPVPMYNYQYPQQPAIKKVVEKKHEPSIVHNPKPQVTIIRDSSLTYYSEAYGEVADESVLTNSKEDDIPKMKILVIGSQKSGKSSVIKWMLHREYCGSVKETGSAPIQNNILIDKSSSSNALVLVNSKTSSTPNSIPNKSVASEFRKIINEPGIGQVQHYYVEVNGDLIQNREAIARLVTKSFDAILIVIDHTRIEEEFEMLQAVIHHLGELLQTKKLMIIKTKCDDSSLLTRSHESLSHVERRIRELVRQNNFYYFEYLSLLASESTTKISPSFGNRLFKFFLPLLASKTRG
jgi:GTPase SAR1 family protein